MSEADSLLDLGGRLIEERDRKTYAELVLWLRSLPPQDEMMKLAQMLGFLTLIGKELPAALTEQLKQIDGVREQIASLPQQILNGLDPEDFADGVSERFRQQLANTGLHDSAKLLTAATTSLQKLAGQIANAVQPLVHQYAGIADTTSIELEKLRIASARLQQDNAKLAAQAAEDRLLWRICVCLVLVCVGFVGGFYFEKKNTTEWIASVDGRVDQISQKVTAPPPSVSVPAAKPQRIRPVR